MPQEPSEIRRVERKSRAEAKQQALKIGTLASPIDEQKNQLLPANREGYEFMNRNTLRRVTFFSILSNISVSKYNRD